MSRKRGRPALLDENRTFLGTIDDLILHARDEEALAAFRTNPEAFGAILRTQALREIRAGGLLMAYRGKIRDEAEQALRRFADAPPPAEKVAAEAHARVRAFFELNEWLRDLAPDPEPSDDDAESTDQDAE